MSQLNSSLIKDRALFASRVVYIDSYMAPSLSKQYGVLQAKGAGSAIPVLHPVVRIFGATPAGQKCCVHIHGAYPYLYAKVNDIRGALQDPKLFTRLLEEGIERELSSVVSPIVEGAGAAGGGGGAGGAGAGGGGGAGGAAGGGAGGGGSGQPLPQNAAAAQNAAQISSLSSSSAAATVTAPSAPTQHWVKHQRQRAVYCVTLVRGTPYFGFHFAGQNADASVGGGGADGGDEASGSVFAKIVLYNPMLVKRTADILLSGVIALPTVIQKNDAPPSAGPPPMGLGAPTSIMNNVGSGSGAGGVSTSASTIEGFHHRPFLETELLKAPLQPYESHTSFLLQFLSDFNLSGMSLLCTSHVRFRLPLPASKLQLPISSPSRSTTARKKREHITVGYSLQNADSSSPSSTAKTLSSSLYSRIWLSSTTPPDLCHPPPVRSITQLLNAYHAQQQNNPLNHKRFAIDELEQMRHSHKPGSFTKFRPDLDLIHDTTNTTNTTIDKGLSQTREKTDAATSSVDHLKSSAVIAQKLTTSPLPPPPPLPPPSSSQQQKTLQPSSLSSSSSSSSVFASEMLHPSRWGIVRPDDFHGYSRDKSGHISREATTELECDVWTEDILNPLEREALRVAAAAAATRSAKIREDKKRRRDHQRRKGAHEEEEEEDEGPLDLSLGASSDAIQFASVFSLAYLWEEEAQRRLSLDLPPTTKPPPPLDSTQRSIMDELENPKKELAVAAISSSSSSSSATNALTMDTSNEGYIAQSGIIDLDSAMESQLARLVAADRAHVNAQKRSSATTEPDGNYYSSSQFFADAISELPNASLVTFGPDVSAVRTAAAMKAASSSAAAAGLNSSSSSGRQQAASTSPMAKNSPQPLESHIPSLAIAVENNANNGNTGIIEDDDDDLINSSALDWLAQVKFTQTSRSTSPTVLAKVTIEGSSLEEGDDEVKGDDLPSVSVGDLSVNSEFDGGKTAHHLQRLDPPRSRAAAPPVAALTRATSITPPPSDIELDKEIEEEKEKKMEEEEEEEEALLDVKQGKASSNDEKSAAIPFNEDDDQNSQQLSLSSEESDGMEDLEGVDGGQGSDKRVRNTSRVKEQHRLRRIERIDKVWDDLRLSQEEKPDFLSAAMTTSNADAPLLLARSGQKKRSLRFIDQNRDDDDDDDDDDEMNAQDLIIADKEKSMSIEASDNNHEKEEELAMLSVELEDEAENLLAVSPTLFSSPRLSSQNQQEHGGQCASPSSPYASFGAGLHVFKMAWKPPSSRDLVSSFPRYGLPEERHEVPHYSVGSDVPKTAKLNAGLVFRVPGYTAEHLPIFDTKASCRLFDVRQHMDAVASSAISSGVHGSSVNDEVSSSIEATRKENLKNRYEVAISQMLTHENLTSLDSSQVGDGGVALAAASAPATKGLSYLSTDNMNVDSESSSDDDLDLDGGGGIGIDNDEVKRNSEHRPPSSSSSSHFLTATSALTTAVQRASVAVPLLDKAMAALKKVMQNTQTDVDRLRPLLEFATAARQGLILPQRGVDVGGNLHDSSAVINVFSQTQGNTSPINLFSSSQDRPGFALLPELLAPRGLLLRRFRSAQRNFNDLSLSERYTCKKLKHVAVISNNIHSESGGQDVNTVGIMMSSDNDESNNHHQRTRLRCARMLVRGSLPMPSQLEMRKWLLRHPASSLPEQELQHLTKDGAGGGRGGGGLPSSQAKSDSTTIVGGGGGIGGSSASSNNTTAGTISQGSSGQMQKATQISPARLPPALPLGRGGRVRSSIIQVSSSVGVKAAANSHVGFKRNNTYEIPTRLAKKVTRGEGREGGGHAAVEDAAKIQTTTNVDNNDPNATSPPPPPPPPPPPLQTSSQSSSGSIGVTCDVNQYLTVMSLEVHAKNSDGKLPDPRKDALCAIFYAIADDHIIESERIKRASTSSSSSSSSSSDDGSEGAFSFKNSLILGCILVSTEESSSYEGQGGGNFFPKSEGRHDVPSGSILSRPSFSFDQGGAARVALGIGNEVHVSTVPDELSLLWAFVALTRSFDVDVIVGYEAQMSSLGYILDRAVNLGLDLTPSLSRTPSGPQDRRHNNDTWGSNHDSGIWLTGRIVLNVWRIMKHELKTISYDLENVAWHSLRVRIPHFPPSVLTYWWENNKHSSMRSRVVDYFTSRAAITLQLLDHYDVMGRTSEIARLFGIDFFSVLSRGSQFRVEAVMMRVYRPLGFLAPSPSAADVAKQAPIEAVPLILEPHSRVFSSPVVVLDFASLYPSIIIAYNMCFSTCLGRLSGRKDAINSKLGFSQYQPPVGALSAQYEGPGVASYVRRISPTEKLNARPKRPSSIFISPNGTLFSPWSARQGILPRMLREILDTRVMVKAAMKTKEVKSDPVATRVMDARQFALKMIANVTYGYTAASFSGRMPCVEIADAIVQTARSTLENALRIVESEPAWRAKVVYGDTDSLFVSLPGRSVEDALRIGQEMADRVTLANPRPIQLKMEKVYHPCVLVTKKRYAGFMVESLSQLQAQRAGKENPVLDCKGLEMVRRDNCPLTSSMMDAGLRLLFSTLDLSSVKSYIVRQFEKILEGRASVKDFIFAKEVRLGSYSNKGPQPPGAVVATRAIRLDPRAEPRYGERVPYVVVSGPPGDRIVDQVISPIEFLRGQGAYRLNFNYYITRIIIPSLERVFSLAGAELLRWHAEMRRPMQRRLRAPKPSTIANLQQRSVPLLLQQQQQEEEHHQQEQQQQKKKKDKDKEEAVVYDLSSSPDEMAVVLPSSNLSFPPIPLPPPSPQPSSTRIITSNASQSRIHGDGSGGGGGGGGGGISTKLIIPTDLANRLGTRGGGSRGGRGRRGGGRGGGDAGYGAEAMPSLKSGPFRPVSKAGGAGVASSGPPTTVDGYFGNILCELCGGGGVREAGAVLCRECASDSQRSTLVLIQRLHEAQRSEAKILSLCMACTGIRDPRADIGAAACDSLSCPVLYERHKIGLETAHIQAVLDEL